MDNPQELKKAILAVLAEKGDFDEVLDHIEDMVPEDKQEEAKQAAIRLLVERGEYKKVLKVIKKQTEEGRKKVQEEKMSNMMEPMSAFADLISKNAEGTFVPKITETLLKDLAEKHDLSKQEVRELMAEMKDELAEMSATDWKNLSDDVIARLDEGSLALESKMTTIASDLMLAEVAKRVPEIIASARPTEEETAEVIRLASLEVESQISDIIEDYIEEYGIEAEQITGLDEAVRKLLPKERVVSWDSIVGKPDISQGGTNANLVNALIAEALANFTGGGVPPGGITGQVLTKLSNTDGDADWQDPASGGVTDGDKGDITVSGGGTVWIIDNNAVTTAKIANSNVTLAKIEDIAHNHFIGRHASGSGTPQQVSPAQARTMLGLATVATSGDYNDLDNLPDLSVFDEVEQYANLAAFPVTGNVNKFYLAQDTGIMYRWTGTTYDIISASLALGETSTTAYRGDRGKEAYDHSQIVTGNPHNTLAEDITDFVKAAQDAVGNIISSPGTIGVTYDDAATPATISLEVNDNGIPANKLASSNGFSIFGKPDTGAGAGQEIDIPPSSVLGRGATGNVVALTAGAGITITDTEIQATGGGGGISEELAIAYAVAL